jgi:hypothetical protein
MQWLNAAAVTATGWYHSGISTLEHWYYLGIGQFQHAMAWAQANPVLVGLAVAVVVLGALCLALLYRFVAAAARMLQIIWACIWFVMWTVWFIISRLVWLMLRGIAEIWRLVIWPALRFVGRLLWRLAYFLVWGLGKWIFHWLYHRSRIAAWVYVIGSTLSFLMFVNTAVAWLFGEFDWSQPLHTLLFTLLIVDLVAGLAAAVIVQVATGRVLRRAHAH